MRKAMVLGMVAAGEEAVAAAAHGSAARSERADRLEAAAVGAGDRHRRVTARWQRPSGSAPHWVRPALVRATGSR